MTTVCHCCLLWSIPSLQRQSQRERSRRDSLAEKEGFCTEGYVQNMCRGKWMCATVCCVVSCYSNRSRIGIMLRIWSWALVFRDQQLSIVILEKEDCQFPFCPFPFFSPSAPAQLSLTFLIPSTFHLSCFSSDAPVTLWHRRQGCCGKGFRNSVRWRGESITPHEEENTGAFLLDKAAADTTKNILCPVLVLCSLGTGTRSFECTSVLLKLPLSWGNKWLVQTV